jgi:hypothetical protein
MPNTAMNFAFHSSLVVVIRFSASGGNDPGHARESAAASDRLAVGCA